MKRDDGIGYFITGMTVIALLIFGAFTFRNSNNGPDYSSDQQIKVNQKAEEALKSINSAPVEDIPRICDGSTIKSNCERDGVEYATYIYHPAVAEVSHTERVTTYEKKISGYCTLCNDGTYSPSCATGRGACSWHGGVAQWNAPRYTTVPVYTEKKVVDTPAKAAYYEKVLK